MKNKFLSFLLKALFQYVKTSLLKKGTQEKAAPPPTRTGASQRLPVAKILLGLTGLLALGVLLWQRLRRVAQPVEPSLPAPQVLPPPEPVPVPAPVQPSRKRFPVKRFWGVAGIVLTIGTLAALIILAFPHFQSWLLKRDYEQARNWSVSASDTFDIGEAMYWSAADGLADQNIHPWRTNGRWVITVGPTSDSDVVEAFYYEHAVVTGDFLVTMEVTTPIHCYTGLVFQGNIAGEYYSFFVDEQKYFVSIWHKENDVFPDSESAGGVMIGELIPEEVGQPYLLGVLKQNGTYYFYINNTLVNQMNDTRLSGERVGAKIMVCNNTGTDSVFTLDNFTLRTPGK